MNPQKTNILILDDEPDIRGEIFEFLVSSDFNVHEAGTPSEAFRVMSVHPIDIAIIDVHLPEMSGLEVLKEMQSSYPEIQVIMMSGHGDMESMAYALQLGAFDYFQKPFRLFKLLETIEKVRQCVTKVCY